jgi:hypothetical protein
VANGHLPTCAHVISLYTFNFLDNGAVDDSSKAKIVELPNFTAPPFTHAALQNDMLYLRDEAGLLWETPVGTQFIGELVGALRNNSNDTELITNRCVECATWSHQ